MPLNIECSYSVIIYSLKIAMSMSTAGSGLSDTMNVLSNNLSPPRIVPRCVTGACHSANRRSMDWSESCGLVAFGSHGTVVVIDMVSHQVEL